VKNAMRWILKAAKWVLREEMERCGAAVEEYARAKRELEHERDMLREALKDSDETRGALIRRATSAEGQLARAAQEVERLTRKLERPVTVEGRIRFVSDLSEKELQAALAGQAQHGTVRAMLAMMDMQWVEAMNRATADGATDRQIHKAHGEAEGLMVLKRSVEARVAGGSGEQGA
jgi:chromosome segregation ATPase